MFLLVAVWLAIAEVKFPGSLLVMPEQPRLIQLHLCFALTCPCMFEKGSAGKLLGSLTTEPFRSHIGCLREDFRDYIMWRDGSDAWPLARESFNSELSLFRANASGDLGASGCCQYGEALERDYMKDIETKSCMFVDR